MKIGNKIIHLDSVDSTSNYIANLLKTKKVENGTVVLADNQVDGRGQRGAEWVVKPGKNITLSFLLGSVNLSVEDQFFLTELVSLTVIDLLQKMGLKAEIKWPNDIFVNGKRIAGILIENQLGKSIIKSSIIGIGLNVNQTEFEGFVATSIKKETNQFRGLMDVIFSFIESFNQLSARYSIHQRDEIHKEYLSNLFLFNIVSTFEDDSGVFLGKIIDVQTTGQLIIESEWGKKEYNLKEISFLKKD